MLGDITVADEIYVICGYTDMRKSIDGLCAVVKDQLNMNPSRPNAIYLFCGRRSDRIKVLLHEREGFVLLYKRLDANVGKYPVEVYAVIVPARIITAFLLQKFFRIL